jgi:hypothetical protein
MSGQFKISISPADTTPSIVFPPSPLRGEGRGGGDLAAELWREVTPTSRGRDQFSQSAKIGPALSSPLKGEEAKNESVSNGQTLSEIAVLATCPARGDFGHTEGHHS